MVLVFDSSNEYLGIDRQNTPKLTVVASRNADAYIKKYIDSVPEKQRRNLRVVSSDNEVYYYAKSAYAEPVRSEEFWNKLDKRRRS
jgi:predicted RNA-binding protein with PIN domain